MVWPRPRGRRRNCRPWRGWKRQGCRQRARRQNLGQPHQPESSVGIGITPYELERRRRQWHSVRPLLVDEPDAEHPVHAPTKFEAVEGPQLPDAAVLSGSPFLFKEGWTRHEGKC